jgi:hypothetical protein
MSEKSSSVARADAREARGWKEIQAGVFLVLCGFGCQWVYFLLLVAGIIVQFVMVAMEEKRATSQDVDVVLPLLLTLVSLIGSVLVLIGRYRCLYGPKTAKTKDAIQCSLLATVVLLLAGTAGSYLSMMSALGEKVDGYLLLGLLGVNLISLFGAEYFFLDFLRRVSRAIKDDALGDRVNEFRLGASVLALIGLGGIGAVVASEWAVRAGQELPQYVAIYIVGGVLIFSGVALIVLGWYVFVLHAAGGALSKYRERAIAARTVVALGDEPAPAEIKKPVRSADGDADFERYFLDEAGLNDQPGQADSR